MVVMSKPYFVTQDNETPTDQNNDIEFQRKAITVRGLSGLRNIGNTCYMNSGLQCLFATNMLTSYFINKNFVSPLKNNMIDIIAHRERKRLGLPPDSEVSIKNTDLVKGVKNSVSYAYFKTVRTWLSGNHNVEPYTFKQNIGRHNTQFSDLSQNDSQELINCVLDAIHDDLKCAVILKYSNIPKSVLMCKETVSKIKKAISDLSETQTNEKQELIQLFNQYVGKNIEDYTILSAMQYWKRFIEPQHSIIRDIFTGLTNTHTCCHNCGVHSLAFEPFLMLSIAIPKSETSEKLEDALRQHTTKFELSDNNKYHCTTCNSLQSADQRTTIWESPEILIIHLKRFSNEIIGNRCITRRNNTKIEFPLNGLDISDYCSPYNKRDNNTYELYGIVQQFGSLNGGHYIACCKNSINDKWYRFDDSNVTHIPESDFQSHLTISNAYILFYKRTYTLE